MAEPWFRFPVVCPRCGQEELSAMQIGWVAAALVKDDVIQLYASCHGVYWDARPTELAQIRQYLSIATAATPDRSEQGPPDRCPKPLNGITA